MRTSQPTPTNNETGRQSPRAPSLCPQNRLSEPVSRRLPATRALPPLAHVVLLLRCAPAAAAAAAGHLLIWRTPGAQNPTPFLTLADCAPAASPDASAAAHRRCCWSLLVVVWQGVDVH
jgi:hypothetical protein